MGCSWSKSNEATKSSHTNSGTDSPTKVKKNGIVDDSIPCKTIAKKNATRAESTHLESSGDIKSEKEKVKLARRESKRLLRIEQEELQREARERKKREGAMNKQKRLNVKGSRDETKHSNVSGDRCESSDDDNHDSDVEKEKGQGTPK